MLKLKWPYTGDINSVKAIIVLQFSVILLHIVCILGKFFLNSSSVGKSDHLSLASFVLTVLYINNFFVLFVVIPTGA